jgi:hypothetical protein
MALFGMASNQLVCFGALTSLLFEGELWRSGKPVAL